MERKQEFNTTKRQHHRSRTGISLVIIGIILLVGNLGMIPQKYWDIIYQWPTVFLIIAIINLLKRKLLLTFVFGALWTFFVLPDIFPEIKIDMLRDFWPVLIILVGILFLNIHKKKNFFAMKNKKIPRDADNTIEEVVIFSGIIKRIESTNFQGGEITSIFGGTELYFNNSKLSPEGATIELINVFGGIKFIIPKDWNVKIEITSILGGFADKRVYIGNETTSSQTLTIKGITILGGGELTTF
jgi:predicted membrane protein